MDGSVVDPASYGPDDCFQLSTGGGGRRQKHGGSPYYRRSFQISAAAAVLSNCAGGDQGLPELPHRGRRPGDVNHSLDLGLPQITRWETREEMGDQQFLHLRSVQ